MGPWVSKLCQGNHHAAVITDDYMPLDCGIEGGEYCFPIHRKKKNSKSLDSTSFKYDPDTWPNFFHGTPHFAGGFRTHCWPRHHGGAQRDWGSCLTFQNNTQILRTSTNQANVYRWGPFPQKLYIFQGVVVASEEDPRDHVTVKYNRHSADRYRIYRDGTGNTYQASQSPFGTMLITRVHIFRSWRWPGKPWRSWKLGAFSCLANLTKMASDSAHQYYILLSSWTLNWGRVNL